MVNFIDTQHIPLNKDTDHSHRSVSADSPVDIPGLKPPCKSYKLIGVYEGAEHYSGLTYRPAGNCKMRDQGSGEFCFVCKYLIVNRVNGSLHSRLDEQYPTSKK